MSDRDHELRERAYHIWEAEGRPDGRAEVHWQMAEIAAAVFGYMDATAPAEGSPDHNDGSAGTEALPQLEGRDAEYPLQPERSDRAGRNAGSLEHGYEPQNRAPAQSRRR